MCFHRAFFEIVFLIYRNLQNLQPLSWWWFQRFVIFTPTWGNDPIWLIFFKLGWFNHQLVVFLFASNPKFWQLKSPNPPKTHQIHSLFCNLQPNPPQKPPETPIRLARSFNLRPSSWSWIVKVSSIFAPGGVFETATKHGGKRRTHPTKPRVVTQLQGDDESRWYFFMYDYKVYPKKLYWKSAAVTNLKKTILVSRDMVVKTYHRGDEGNGASEILWKQNQSVQGEGGICLKETSRDEKHKNMAASHWTDATCRKDFSHKKTRSTHGFFFAGQLCSFARGCYLWFFGVKEFAVNNHQDSSTKTRDLTELGTVLWNHLEVPRAGNNCPLWNYLDCYTYSWRKSSEFSQRGRLDPPPKC